MPRVAIDIGVPDGDEVVGSTVGSTVVAIGASVGPSVGFADVGLAVVGDIVEGTPDGLFEIISVGIVVGGIVEESDGNNVGCSVAGISVVGVSVCTGGVVEVVVAAVGTPVVVPIISVGINVGSGVNVGGVL